MTEKSLPHMFSIQTRNGSGYKEIYSSAGEKAEADFPSDFHLEKLEDMENELLKKTTLVRMMLRHFFWSLSLTLQEAKRQ